MLRNKTTTLYLLRHGQTEHNVLRIIQGHNDSALTQEGINATKIRAGKLKDSTFDSLFCSDLERARKSLEIIVTEWDCDISIKYRPEIREIDFGQFTGKNIDEMKDIILSYKADKTKSYPDGESGCAFGERVINFVEDVLARYEGRTVLIMTHFGVIESILKHYIKELDDRLNTKNYDIGVLYFDNNGVKFRWI